MSAIAGIKSESTRSDCFVEISIQKSRRNIVQVHSRVESLYGNSIRKLCMEMLDFYQVNNLQLEITDTGALPFVISARIETALNQLIPSDKEFLQDMLPQNQYKSSKNRIRRSRLYLPGNNPRLMINAGIYSADGIILDLEDSVSPDKKDEARILVRNALRRLDFNGAERMVRINQLPEGIKDLKFIVPHNVHLILIPKCEGPGEIIEVENEISNILGRKNNTIHLMPIVESALGVENAYQIAISSGNIAAIAIGLEDYTADIGVSRTDNGRESLYARTRLINAANAAHIQAIDSVYSDFKDTDKLAEIVNESRSLGFSGMGCIHPSQVRIVNEGFLPDNQEIQKAQEIVIAFEKAEKKSRSVVSLGGKMIDPPVVKRAIHTTDIAILSGKLNKDWRGQYE